MNTADGTEDREVEPGVAEVRRAFRPGDVVELELPLAPRLTAPDARIDAVRGCFAVERGPEVLALESVDLSPAGVDDVGLVALATGAEPVERDGRVWIDVVRLPEGDTAWPYRDAAGRPVPSDGAPVPLVAYHEWAERGPSTMRVWIPVA